MPSATATPAPDWAKVPFDVRCARCGCDLRGRSEPRCPACHFKFDWSDAVPVEKLTCLTCGYHLYGLDATRCPECGGDFTWDDVLHAYRRRRVPLFEYGFRERPLRTLRFSWWLALRPWKLWRTVKLHDPPAKRGLLVLVLVAAAIFVLVPPICLYAGGWIVATLHAYRWTGSVRFVAPPGLPISADYIRVLLIVAAWAVAGLLSLLLLGESMRRCRVRATHVLRAYTYSLLTAVTGETVFCLSHASCELIRALAPSAARAWLDALQYEQLPGIIVLATLLWMILSLWLAYRCYLRMRHALAVALLTQFIAVLCGMVVAVLIR